MIITERHFEQYIILFFLINKIVFSTTKKSFSTEQKYFFRKQNKFCGDALSCISNHTNCVFLQKRHSLTQSDVMLIGIDVVIRTGRRRATCIVLRKNYSYNNNVKLMVTFKFTVRSLKFSWQSNYSKKRMEKIKYI